MASPAPPEPLAAFGAIAAVADSDAGPAPRRLPPSPTFPCLYSVKRSTTRDTCRLAIERAAQDNTLLFLSCLPPELRALVDGFVIEARWQSRPRAVQLEVPAFSRELRGHYTRHMVRLRSGRRILVTSSHDGSAVRHQLICG